MKMIVLKTLIYSFYKKQQFMDMVADDGSYWLCYMTELIYWWFCNE